MPVPISARWMPDINKLGNLLKSYGLASPQSVEPYLPSVLTATYTLESRQGGCLVRLFESGGEETAYRAAQLLHCFHDAQIPCALAISQPGGEWVGKLNEYAALVLESPRGSAPDHYSLGQCEALGALLARLHLATHACENASVTAPAVREWRERVFSVAALLPPDDVTLLQEEMRYQGLYRFDDLPQGLVGGTGLEDRVLFENDFVMTVIGLEQTWHDTWLLDLADTVTGCCEGVDRSLGKDQVRVLLAAYHQIRPLKAIERGAWPVMLRAVALRRWVQAIQDQGALSSATLMGRSRLLDRIAQEHLYQRFWS